MNQSKNSEKTFSQNIFYLETVLDSACVQRLNLKHRLELRKLIFLLSHSTKQRSRSFTKKKHIEPYQALLKFKANLQRRKKTSDMLASSRLMEIPEPARSVLLSDIAYTFRNEVDEYTQIDFSNAMHIELLGVAVDNSISKVSYRQGRPINEPLDEFLIGLRDLYEAATGNKAFVAPRPVFLSLHHI